MPEASIHAVEATPQTRDDHKFSISPKASVVDDDERSTREARAVSENLGLREISVCVEV